MKSAEARIGKVARAAGARLTFSLLAESGFFHSLMYLALKFLVLALGKKRRMGRNCVAESLNPGDVFVGESAQQIIMHEGLVAGMADADPHPPIVVAEMSGQGI